MANCKNNWSQITLWLDGELQADEIALLQSHLDECVSCRERVESERRFLETVRATKLGHVPSEELTARVESILQQESPAQSSLPTPDQDELYPATVRVAMTHRVLLAIAAVLLVVVALGVWRVARQNAKPVATGPSSFALMAADTHRRYLQRQLPLEIVSDLPDEISAWFTGKVSFGVKLPNYEEPAGQRKLYTLEGARLVGYQNDYAAYVAYQMDRRPISLVVTSEMVARPAGGEEIKARGLTFHFDAIYGYKVITWSDRGLTYALVSDLDERGQQSCVVCHQKAEDKELLNLSNKQ